MVQGTNFTVLPNSDLSCGEALGVLIPMLYLNRSTQADRAVVKAKCGIIV